jgi:hypothetical protein
MEDFGAMFANFAEVAEDMGDGFPSEDDDSEDNGDDGLLFPALLSHAFA